MVDHHQGLLLAYPVLNYHDQQFSEEINCDQFENWIGRINHEQHRNSKN